MNCRLTIIYKIRESNAQLFDLTKRPKTTAVFSTKFLGKLGLRRNRKAPPPKKKKKFVVFFKKKQNGQSSVARNVSSSDVLRLKSVWQMKLFTDYFLPNPYNIALDSAIPSNIRAEFSVISLQIAPSHFT